MVFFIIGFLILFYSIINFKKGFSLYLTFKLVLVTNITLISIPGIPLLTLEMFLTLSFILLFFSRGAKYQNAAMPFPYKIPFSILFICWLISSVFAVSGFFSELSNLIKNISEEIILIWMMWETFETKEDFKRLYKYITIVMLFSCIYAFIEFSIQDNPLALYEATLNKDESRNMLALYSIEDRGYRVQSCFSHTIGAGINWSMYAIFTIWLWINSNRQRSFPKISLITAFLCIPCIILTKMRSPLLFTLIAALSLINVKKKKFYLFIPIACILFYLLRPIINENIMIFSSFFNESAQEAVGGSDLAMRLKQLNIAIRLIRVSPLVGLGNKFYSVIPQSFLVGLSGMESIWLWVIVQFGFLGIVCYVFYMIYSIIIIPYRFSSRPMLFFAAAYWITYTTTSLPGMKLYLYFLIMIYLIKNSKKYQAEKIKGDIYGVYFLKGKLKYNIIKRQKNEAG